MKSKFFSVIYFSAAAFVAASTVSGQILVGPKLTLPIEFSNSLDWTLSGGTLEPTNVTLSGEMQLTDDSFVIRPQNPLVRDNRGNLIEQTLGPTNLNGSIAGPAGLTLSNQSRDLLVIGGDNTYDGQTIVDAGQIVATSPTAFGSTAGSTTVRGGELTVQAATEEQFRIEGGVLRFDAGDFAPEGSLSITGGEVFLPQRDFYTLEAVVDDGDTTGGTLRFGFDDSASWTGGSSGVGNLTLAGRVNVDSPLTHDGDLTIAGVNLNAANTYTGRTIITDTFTIDRADVFGTSTSQIEIEEASVTVNVVPDGDRGFDLKWGTLDVQTTQPIEGPITLGGRFSANIRGNGTFNGPIDYVTTSGGGNALLSSGTFNGPIRGDTSLSLGSSGQTVTLNAANDMNGNILIRGGTVIANHADAINLPNTRVQGGTLELNTPAVQSALIEGGVLQLNLDQQIEDTLTVDVGTIAVAGDVSFQKLRLLADIGSLTSEASRAVAVGDGSIDIAGEAVAYGNSEIGGKIVGSGVVRAAIQSNFAGGLNLSGDWSEFTGSIIADRGDIFLDRSSDGFTTGLSLNPDAELHVFEGGEIAFGDGDRIIENDIFLHNTGGASDSKPALSGRFNGTRTLAGRVDVGETGSTITDSFDVTGELTGSNLTIRNGFLDIQSAQNELSGTLRLNSGSVALNGAGQLHGLDEILIDGGGRLSLAVNGGTDIVDDETRIRSRGGSISLTSGRLPTSETIGTLQLEREKTSVFASSDHGNAAATLTFDKLERNVGTLLEFRDAGQETEFKILDTERFETTGEQMLGGWATFNNGEFASIDANGIIGRVTHTETSINEAGANDHVQAAGSQVLSGDKEIASLYVLGGQSVNLTGHKLTVRSGGIRFAPDITNGQLTAGDGDAAAELFFHQGISVSADIVDNGPSGAVSVVVGNDSRNLRLSGTNTYSGGTYILGDNDNFGSDRGRLTIESLSAIPENERVFVNGGHYQLSLTEPGTVKLDELHLRSGGFVAGGSNNPFDIDNVFLEHGNFQAGLTGDGTIYKDTGEHVTFSSSVSSPGYTGQIVVRDGSLSFNQQDLLPNAQVRVEGGEFQILDLSRAFNNDIHLDGGALSGGRFIQGDVFVDSESTIIANGVNTILRGRLIGDENLTIQGSLRNYTSSYVGIFGDASEFQGDFDIQSGALRIGSPGSLGDGEITIQEGGRLILGSDRETSPATSIDNTIHVRGGSLISVPPRRSFDGVAPPSFATGDVHIHSEAYVGAIWPGNSDGEYVPALTFSGRLILADNAEIYGVSEGRVIHGDQPLTNVSGELLVGEQTSWNVGTSSIGVSGIIRPVASESSIDFRGAEDSMVFFGTQLATEEGKSLALTINGSSDAFAVQGVGSGITGDGTYIGDLVLFDGAVIAPGNSPGLLTVDGNVTIGSGTIYDWEIASINGVPGEAWDLLHVNGDLLFAASPDDPWSLRISDLSGFSSELSDSWLIASAENILGFDPLAFEIDSASSGTTGDRFSLRVEGGNLFLVSSVPEPSSVTLLGVGLITLISRRRRSSSAATQPGHVSV